MELWTKKEIMEIANKIGKFYYVDEGSAGLLEKWVAWFFIEPDSIEGLPATLDIY